MGKTSTKTRSTVTGAASPQLSEAEIQTVVANLELEVERLTENAAIYNAWDNLGWEPLGGLHTRGIDLTKLNEWAKTNRALVGVNPLIKQATRVRVAYIFGEGVQFGEPGTKLAPRAEAFLESNADHLFSEQGYEELEVCLNTDGNIFMLLERKDRKVTRVPMAQISKVATRTDSAETIMYVKRTWEVDRSTGEANDFNVSGTTETKEEWYPIVDLPSGVNRPDSIEGVPVSSTQVMLHGSVNKQLGWTWGLPDLQPTVFWAKAYKEFMESQFVMVKSLAQFAWKVTSSTPRGVQRTAAKVAAPPAVDINGHAANVGATVPLGSGNDLTAINKAGANVSFDTGRALAALATSGLGVPLAQVIPDDNRKNDEVLDVPTLKIMSSRQSFWKRFFQKMFKHFSLEIPIIFPPIQAEPIHRTVQAITTAASTNALHPKEVRKMLVLALRSLGIDPEATLPRAGAMAKFVGGAVNTNPGTPPQKTPDATGGKRSPAGPLADGDHEMRDSEEVLAFVDRVVALLSERTGISV